MKQVPRSSATPTPTTKRDTKDLASDLARVPEMAQREVKPLPPENKDAAPGISTRPVLKYREGLNAGLDNVQSIVDEVEKLNARVQN